MWKYTPPALDTAPQAPTGLTASAGAYSVRLAWTDNASNETGYRVERSSTGGEGTFVVIAELGPDSVGFVDKSISGTDAGATFHYRVIAHNSVGDSSAVSVSATIAQPPQAVSLNETDGAAATQSLQDAANAGQTTLSFQVSDAEPIQQRAQVEAFVYAVASIAVAEPVEIVINLANIDTSGLTVSVPENVTLIVQNGTLHGASPSFTLTAGDVVLLNFTLTNATAAPTVRVIRGNLTIRNSRIFETTLAGADGAQAAIEIQGGTIDLGTAADPGNNEIRINGAGMLIRNLGSAPVSAVGNTFYRDDEIITSGFALEDAIEHALDQAGVGLVTYLVGQFYVTPQSGSIQRAIDAAPAGSTIYIAGSGYDPYELGDKNVSLVFGPLAKPDSFSTMEDLAITGNVLDNDDLSDGITLRLLGGPSHGTLSLHSDGTFVYTPGIAADATSDSFTYELSDGNGGVSTATVHITIHQYTGVSLIDGILRIGGTSGNDTVTVSGGNLIYNGATISLAGVSEIRVWGRTGNDLIDLGGVSVPTLIFGGDGDDVLVGGSGDDLILGGAGNDTITGSAGNDFLIGGDGSDRIVGSAGHDILTAGDIACKFTVADLRAALNAWAANRDTDLDDDGDDDDYVVTDDDYDILTGSSGSDWFIISRGDKITDLAKPNQKDADWVTYV